MQVAEVCSRTINALKPWIDRTSRVCASHARGRLLHGHCARSLCNSLCTLLVRFVVHALCAIRCAPSLCMTTAPGLQRVQIPFRFLRLTASEQIVPTEQGDCQAVRFLTTYIHWNRDSSGSLGIDVIACLSSGSLLFVPSRFHVALIPVPLVLLKRLNAFPSVVRSLDVAPLLRPIVRRFCRR